MKKYYARKGIIFAVPEDAGPILKRGKSNIPLSIVYLVASAEHYFGSGVILRFSSSLVIRRNLSGGTKFDALGWREESKSYFSCHGLYLFSLG